MIGNKLKLVLLSLLLNNNIFSEHQTLLPEDKCKCYACMNRWKEISTFIGYSVWPLEIAENVARKIMYFVDLANDKKYINNLNKKKDYLKNIIVKSMNLMMFQRI